MLKAHFSRFLSSRPSRLHFAAHSHHPWPDVSFGAHQQAWLDAARLIDDKWNHVFSSVIPSAARHIAQALDLPRADSIVFAPNTREFVLRLLSCLGPVPHVVTTDAEFHSAERQFRRLEEAQALTVERVATEPFASFNERLLAACARRTPDLVFFSHVFFNSGFEVRGLETLVAQLPLRSLIAIDGYHAFLAVPVALRSLAERVFYLAGGYKYAMAGEGACFLHVPEGEFRPRDTGWFAAFGALEDRVSGRVPYASHGAAFGGATFDPSGLYRFNAVMQWRAAVALTVTQSREHVHRLQQRFVADLADTTLSASTLVVPLQESARGQFLTFRTPQAREWAAKLKALEVDVDARDDRLRFGFGVYHDDADVDSLLDRLRSVAPQ